jgi:DNA-binding CsgD family transcriptional regulator
MAVQAERDLIRHCHSSLDVAQLRREVLRSLRRLVPVDAAFFATADPETLLFTGAHAEDPLGEATALFLDNEFSGTDVNTFSALARSSVHVATLDGATRDDRFASSRYRDIMRPLGLGDELRAALVAGADCWGYLCLHRADDPSGFTKAEIGLISRVGPHIAHALRQAVLLHGPPADGEAARPGVVLLDGSMNVVASTPEADHLLALIGSDTASRLRLPVPVYSVAAALLRGSALPSARVRTVTGSWLDMHASHLNANGDERRVAVVVEPAEPRATSGILLAAHGLSAREQEVARLVIRGASTRTISATLHISAHTVQDHLKSVFDKVGVRSRRDLVALLLGGR